MLRQGKLQNFHFERVPDSSRTEKQSADSNSRYTVDKSKKRYFTINPAHRYKTRKLLRTQNYKIKINRK